MDPSHGLSQLRSDALKIAHAFASVRGKMAFLDEVVAPGGVLELLHGKPAKAANDIEDGLGYMAHKAEAMRVEAKRGIQEGSETELRNLRIRQDLSDLAGEARDVRTGCEMALRAILGPTGRRSGGYPGLREESLRRRVGNSDIKALFYLLCKLALILNRLGVYQICEHMRLFLVYPGIKLEHTNVGGHQSDSGSSTAKASTVTPGFTGAKTSQRQNTPDGFGMYAFKMPWNDGDDFYRDETVIHQYLQNLQLDKVHEGLTAADIMDALQHCTVSHLHSQDLGVRYWDFLEEGSRYDLASELEGRIIRESDWEAADQALQLAWLIGDVNSFKEGEGGQILALAADANWKKPSAIDLALYCLTTVSLEMLEQFSKDAKDYGDIVLVYFFDEAVAERASNIQPLSKKAMVCSLIAQLVMQLPVPENVVILGTQDLGWGINWRDSLDTLSGSPLWNLFMELVKRVSPDRTIKIILNGLDAISISPNTPTSMRRAARNEFQSLCNIVTRANKKIDKQESQGKDRTHARMKLLMTYLPTPDIADLVEDTFGHHMRSLVIWVDDQEFEHRSLNTAELYQLGERYGHRRKSLPLQPPEQLRRMEGTQTTYDAHGNAVYEPETPASQHTYELPIREGKGKGKASESPHEEYQESGPSSSKTTKSKGSKSKGTKSKGTKSKETKSRGSGKHEKRR